MDIRKKSWNRRVLRKNWEFEMKNACIKSLVTSVLVFGSTTVQADEYQVLAPVAVHTSVSATYIVFANNVGMHGCALDKNNIAITVADHSADMVKASLAIALNSISTGTSIKVYWSGCMASGRPKIASIGIGAAEPN
jgi:hypothetical protein